jgi:predicted glutamine amidotransferase
MCRFVAYSGLPLLLADLLYVPSDSLILQSYHARERREPLNGDGFGVGWYVPEIDSTPCIVRSITPAWSSSNLRHLSFKTRASSLFAHVRAASPGMAVTESNAHPFNCGRFMWMHNGAVAGFHRIKRKLRHGLRDKFYDMIEGTTDSEHAFALFLNELPNLDDVDSAEMRKTLVWTIGRLNELTREAGITAPSYYNFAVTNGEAIVVSRYCSDPDTQGASLHYAHGDCLETLPDGTCDIHSVPPNEKASAVIVASEKLTDERSEWYDVPNNHTVTVFPDLTVKLERIEC